MDPGAERELASVQAGFLGGRSTMWRVAFVLAVLTPAAGLIAAVAHHAGAVDWWLYAVGFAGVESLFLLPYVFAPEATIRHAFRAMYVSDEDARKPRQFP